VAGSFSPQAKVDTVKGLALDTCVNSVYLFLYVVPVPRLTGVYRFHGRACRSQAPSEQGQFAKSRFEKCFVRYRPNRLADDPSWEAAQSSPYRTWPTATTMATSKSTIVLPAAILPHQLNAIPPSTNKHCKQQHVNITHEISKFFAIPVP
jgi:hypothetical protein